MLLSIKPLLSSEPLYVREQNILPVIMMLVEYFTEHLAVDERVCCILIP
jgi:hypothetical protein